MAQWFVSLSRQRTAFIYLIFDAEGTPCYVGKSEHPERRFNEHRVYQRHEWAHSYLVVEMVAPEDCWKERECFWITYYRQWYPLKNVSRGGRGSDSHGVFYRNRNEITALLKTGHLTFVEIGARFGVSGERIRQIALGLKLKSGTKYRSDRRWSREHKEVTGRPLMARFIAQCESAGLRWELLPSSGRSLLFISSALSVEGLTVRLMSSKPHLGSKNPWRNYVGLNALKAKNRDWDIVAYCLPDDRWLLLDRPSQLTKGTSFILDPLPNFGARTHRHNWRRLIDAWHLFKPPSEFRVTQTL